MRQDLILKRPIISEKSMTLTELNQFMFEVDLSATKSQIKKAVEDNFKVNVLEVKTTVNKGKIRRFGAKRMPKQLSNRKKALVKLKKGQKIDLFEIKAEK